MDNSIDKLMDGWGAEMDPDKLFSDQTQEDNAFFFEEPQIGIDDLILDSPQSGIEPKELPRTITNKEIKSQGKPNVFDVENKELEKLNIEKIKNDQDIELTKMFTYIADYGLIHGMGLYYAENLETIEENYGQEESIG